MGETVAARFLAGHGLEVIARNLEVGRGEVDLIAVDGDDRVVVEVRTITGEHDPIDAIGGAKRRQVRGLAGRLGATRVDFVGVRLGSQDVVVHWVPGCG